MESTNQGFPLGGNPIPFSSWGDVGAPHMATLSLPRLTIGLSVWLFSTSVVQNPVILKQSNQQLDDTGVASQPSTSSDSPSPPTSLLDKADEAKNQVNEKKKKQKEKKEKKKKEPKSKGATKCHLGKILTPHRQNLNLLVSFAMETTITEIVPASLGS